MTREGCALAIALLTSSASAAPVSRGIVVVARAQAADVAWPLAQKLYRDRSLLTGIDEPTARVLAGDAPLANAPAPLNDLRALRESLTGDDAPSRLVLTDFCTRFSAKAIAVVSASPALARAFDCSSRAYLRAHYLPDDPEGHTWSGAAHALTLTFGNNVLPIETKPVKDAKESKPFYKSWWFWGAIGGAAAIGGTALIVANAGGSSQMEIQMHIPR